MNKVEHKKIFVLTCISFFSVLLFLFNPHYTLEINTDLNPGFIWNSTYTTELEHLRDSYNELRANGIVDVNGNIVIEQIPIYTDSVRISLLHETGFSINQVIIWLYDIPIKVYSANKMEKITDKSELIYTVNSETLQNAPGITAFSLNLVELTYNNILYLFLALLLIVSAVLGYVFKHFFNYHRLALTLFMSIASPMLAFCSLEIVMDSLWFISLRYKILNYLFVLCLFLIIFFVTNSVFLSNIMCTVTMIMLGITNYYVLLFRGKPVLPWDIKATSTALSIVDGYEFSLTPSMICSILLIVLFVIAIAICKSALITFSRKKCMPVAAITIFVVTATIIVSPSFKNLKVPYWDPYIVQQYQMNGSIVSFCKYAFTSRISKPADYDANVLNSIKYYQGVVELDEDETETVVQPQNIIMIMNESLTDFSEWEGADRENPLEFYYSLMPVSTYGNLYVSVYGGSTCNTEFEVLTGNSLAFLPPGAFPFQSMVTHNIPSLASYLCEQHFSTKALHLENKKNWSRDRAYPFLGFEEFHSISDYTDVKTVRYRATDEYNYDKLIELYEQKTSEKLFIFNTTIQNHGGYADFYDMPEQINWSEYDDFRQARVFLSLMRLSDTAFQKLILYFSQVEEPTMIIIFGDHQPALDEDSTKYLLGNANDVSVKSHLKKYVTPFMIWKNYDSESKYIDKISANYLSSFILREAGIELNDYNKFLLEMYKEFPVITLQGIVDKNGIHYRSIEEIPDSQILKMYESLQYKILFDNN